MTLKVFGDMSAAQRPHRLVHVFCGNKRPLALRGHLHSDVLLHRQIQAAPLHDLTNPINTHERSPMDLAYKQRQDLAGFPQTVAPQEWEGESLCVGWNVKDVVAQFISYEGVSFSGVVERIIRGRLMHVNDIGVAHRGLHLGDRVTGPTTAK